MVTVLKLQLQQTSDRDQRGWVKSAGGALSKANATAFNPLGPKNLGEKDVRRWSVDRSFSGDFRVVRAKVGGKTVKI